MHLTGRWDEAWSLYGSRFDHYSSLKEKMEQLPAGRMWDGKAGGRAVDGGVYVYQIRAEGRAFNGTLVVIR